MSIHLIMPMAGKGSRFVKDGYEFPKPLIKIHGKPFFYWATQSVKKFVELESLHFVVLREHEDAFHIIAEIRKYYPEAIISIIPQVLDGAALTCLEGIKTIEDDLPILFNDCDHAFTCQSFNQFCRQAEKVSIDGALLTFSSKEPKYSFLQYNERGNVIKTVEKEVISNDAICGAYYFKNSETFRKATEVYLQECNYQEYFVSGIYNVMAKQGMLIKGFATDLHIPFGTPEEYEEAKKIEGFKRLEA